MNKAPGLIQERELKHWPTQSFIGNDWVDARPIGYFSLWSRIKLAWGVFTGKYDALRWEGGQ